MCSLLRRSLLCCRLLWSSLWLCLSRLWLSSCRLRSWWLSRCRLLCGGLLRSLLRSSLLLGSLLLSRLLLNSLLLGSLLLCSLLLGLLLLHCLLLCRLLRSLLCLLCGPCRRWLLHSWRWPQRSAGRWPQGSTWWRPRWILCPLHALVQSSDLVWTLQRPRAHNRQGNLVGKLSQYGFRVGW